MTMNQVRTLSLGDATPSPAPARRAVAPVDPLDVPAIVHDLSDRTGKRAIIEHPFGLDHPNAVATKRRLMARGYVIVRRKSTVNQEVTP